MDTTGSAGLAEIDALPGGGRHTWRALLNNAPMPSGAAFVSCGEDEWMHCRVFTVSVSLGGAVEVLV